MWSAIVSIAVVALSPQSAFAHSSELEPAMTMKQVLDDLGPGHSLRLIDDVSQQCRDEMAELAKNNDLANALGDLNIFCSPETDGRSYVKTDYNKCSSTVGKVQLACTSAGGKYSTDSVTINCKGNGKKVTVSAIDMPVCVGKSCDASAVIEEVKNELARAFEQAAAYQGGSASCESPASAIVLSKIAVAGGMLGLLLNLLY